MTPQELGNPVTAADGAVQSEGLSGGRKGYILLTSAGCFRQKMNPWQRRFGRIPPRKEALVIPDPDLKIVPDRDMRVGGVAGRESGDGFLRRHLPKLGGLAGQIVPSVAATVLGAYIVANYVNGKPPATPTSPAAAIAAPEKEPDRTAAASTIRQLPAPAATRTEPKPAEIKPVETAPAEPRPAEQIRIIPMTASPRAEARRSPEKAQEKPKTIRREVARSEPKIEPKIEPRSEPKTEARPEPKAGTGMETTVPEAESQVRPELAAARPQEPARPEPLGSEAHPTSEAAPAASPPAAGAADAIDMARRALERMKEERGREQIAQDVADPLKEQARIEPEPAHPAAPPPVVAPRQEAVAVPALPPPVIVADPPSRPRARQPEARTSRPAGAFDQDRPVPPADIPNAVPPPGFVIVR